MNLFTELARLVSLPVQVVTGKTLFRPFSIGIALAELCNSRCTMCDFWKRKEPYLGIEQMREILAKVKKLGVNIVNYSAHGEMTANPDIREIISYTHDQGFTQTFNTNALLLANRDFARFVAEKARPFLVSIGIDSLDGEVYEQIRGIRNGQLKVISAIRNLQEFGVRNITLGAVVLDYNLDSLTDLVAFAERMNLGAVRVTAYQRYFQDSGNDETWNRVSAPDFQSRLQAKMRELSEMKSSHPVVRNSAVYLDHISEFYQHDYYFPFKCVVGYLRLDIDEHGDVTLCPFMGRPVGNVFEEDLEDIWFSKKAENLRKDMVQGNCPGCLLSCYAEENIRCTPRHAVPVNIEGLKRYARMKKSNSAWVEETASSI